jgi:hypothetical protein
LEPCVGVGGDGDESAVGGEGTERRIREAGRRWASSKNGGEERLLRKAHACSHILLS